jgi:hypothetical protein
MNCQYIFKVGTTSSHRNGHHIAVNYLNLKTKLTKLRGLSPQANYTDRATAAVGEIMRTFAGRGYYMVSAKDSHGR